MAPPLEITPDDIVIVFMGSSGTGKSLFIDLLTGTIGQRASHGLKAKTTKITPVRVKHHAKYGKRIVLVDTPSFDNQNKSDMDVLDEISQWLAKTYTNHVRLTGLIYLHRITDNRMGGSPVKHLQVFRKLCGPSSLDRVVLVSTMWPEEDKLEARQRATERHEELQSGFWKPLINAGSRCDRLEKISHQEAWRIIDKLIERSFTKRSSVQLQGEIVIDEKPLAMTEAGQELVPAAQKRIADLTDELQKLSSEYEKLKRDNPTRAKEVMKKYQHVRKLLKNDRAAADKYKIPLSERIRKVLRKLFGKNKSRKTH